MKNLNIIVLSDEDIKKLGNDLVEHRAHTPLTTKSLDFLIKNWDQFSKSPEYSFNKKLKEIQYEKQQ